MLILNDVYLNGQGPFRMMVDTGNSSSTILPKVASALRVSPAYVVEVATAAGSHKLGAVCLDEVKVAEVTEKSVEVMVSSVGLPNVDGVLGQSFLARHDYLLDYRHGRIVLDGGPPGAAFRMPLEITESRPAVRAQVDGRVRLLALDSGAPALVLFGVHSRPRIASF